MMAFHVREIDWSEFESLLAAQNVDVPIEQTKAWSEYESGIPGRSFWGCVAIEHDGDAVAVAAFMDYLTHRFHYLRSHHGPIWFEAPTPSEEAEALEALRSYVHTRDGKVVFLRLAVDADVDFACHTLSTIPYDTTVVIQTEGGEEGILSRMKPRGRRDVRKSLRECPAEVADETDLAAADFAPYYQIMVETGARDGFAPAPCGDYERLLATLGPEHARVFAARIDGELCAWSIVTISGKVAMRYYAASKNATMRQHVGERLVLFEAESLGKRESSAMTSWPLARRLRLSLWASTSSRQSSRRNSSTLPPTATCPCALPSTAPSCACSTSVTHIGSWVFSHDNGPVKV